MASNMLNLDTSEAKSNEARDVNKKREDYLPWPDYFMAVAFLAAMRSKDPASQVGACVVNGENKIVGVGYNGMPNGCPDDEFPWQKESNDALSTKYMYVCHAEVNAILNKNTADVKGCSIYVAMFPCNECAKVIIQSGIVRVVYMSDKNFHKVETVAARRMFHSAGVEYDKFVAQKPRIVIDFDAIDWNKVTQMPATPIKADVESAPEKVNVSKFTL